MTDSVFFHSSYLATGDCITEIITEKTFQGIFTIIEPSPSELCECILKLNAAINDSETSLCYFLFAFLV